MQNFLFTLSFLLLTFTPLLSFAQSENDDTLFEAQVIGVLEQTITSREDGSEAVSQKLKLLGLEKEWNKQEIVIDTNQFNSLMTTKYDTGDKLIVSHSTGEQGEDYFYITGYARTGAIIWLTMLFALAVILVGRLKGLRALVVLAVSFLVILKIIIPRILAGSDPLITSILGSLLIIIIAIFFTEGFNRESGIAITTITLSLLATGLISIWFTSVAKLTGFTTEEAMYLMEFTSGSINAHGLLLAGIIIGALGVLDDVAISQIAAVKELKKSNPNLNNKQLYQQAMRIGISHLSSMVNTLFLAYAGASLPLLFLFSTKQPPFLTAGQVIGNEMIATEIVRTLAGSIGLVLTVPIATILAVRFIQKKREENVQT